MKIKKTHFLFTVLYVFSVCAVGDPKIGPHAVMPIKQKDYPKLYAAWGPKGVKRINDLMPKAAAKAAESAECDLVELVEISIKRSVPNKKIVIFVDCTNGKRFLFEESELLLKGNNPVVSQETKMASISDSTSISECEKGIKLQIKNPQTFHRKYFTTSVYRASGAGNIEVLFKFEAKNNSGSVITSRARCVISDQGFEAVVLGN